MTALRAAPPPAAPGLIARSRDILRWEGARGLLMRALAAIGYRSMGWYALSLHDAPGSPVPADIQLGALDVPDVDEYLAFRRGATRGQFLGRLAEGYRCLAARSAGRLSSVSWTATRRAHVEYLRHDIDLAADQVYLFDSFTTPEQRGRRLQAAILAGIVEEARRSGLHEAIVLIATHNRANIASRERNGFRRTGLVRSFHFGPWRRLSFRGDCRSGRT